MKKQTTDTIEIYDYRYSPAFVEKHCFPLTLMGGVLLGGICLYGYLVYRKKRRSLSFYQKAINELLAHAAKTYDTREKVRHLYFDLTHIVKWYLEKQYGWSVIHKTDEELLQFLENMASKEFIREKVYTLLSRALSIKFAEGSTLAWQAQEDIQLVRHLIDDIEQSQKAK